MLAIDPRSAVLEHLQNVLNPKRLPEEIACLVEWPTNDPKSLGGLSEQGKEMFKDDKEVIKQAESHQRDTRIKIRAVIATCQKFCRSKTEVLGVSERLALKAGIPIETSGGGRDFIKTTKKGGSVLTKEFKGMISDLWQSTKTSCPKVTALLTQTIKAQQLEELKEKQDLEDISQMA